MSSYLLVIVGRWLQAVSLSQLWAATGNRKFIDDATRDIIDDFRSRCILLLSPLGPPPSHILQRRPPHRRPSSPPYVASHAELRQEGASRRFTRLPLRSTFSLSGLHLETRTTGRPGTIERLSPTGVTKDLALSPDVWRTSKALNLPEETIDRFLSSV